MPAPTPFTVRRGAGRGRTGVVVVPRGQRDRSSPRPRAHDPRTPPTERDTGREGRDAGRNPDHPGRRVGTIDSWLHVSNLEARRYLSARRTLHQGPQRGNHPRAGTGIPEGRLHLVGFGSG